MSDLEAADAEAAQRFYEDEMPQCVDGLRFFAGPAA